jgi:hypothetical protein
MPEDRIALPPFRFRLFLILSVLPAMAGVISGILAFRGFRVLHMNQDAVLGSRGLLLGVGMGLGIGPIAAFCGCLLVAVGSAFGGRSGEERAQCSPALLDKPRARKILLCLVVLTCAIGWCLIMMVL